MSDDEDDPKEGWGKWLAKLVLGAVITAVLGLVLTSGPTDPKTQVLQDVADRVHDALSGRNRGD